MVCITNYISRDILQGNLLNVKKKHLKVLRMYIKKRKSNLSGEKEITAFKHGAGPTYAFTCVMVGMCSQSPRFNFNFNKTKSKVFLIQISVLSILDY